MNVDYSFIRLTKNDFEVAKKGDSPNIATLIYDGFIMQLPNETFTQRTNIDNGIAFAGGITIDLINKCGNLVQNIDNNFYYTSFFDENGISQIEFEFGMIGVNYFTTPLYLRITDQINGNIYYSNGFLVTDYYANISTRFDYKNANDTLVKSIRIANCFKDTPQNKLELKSYTTTKGFQTSYRQIPTYLQKYTIETLDFFANDRLVDLFCHSVIYVNGMRCSVSDYKTEDRKGTTNILSAEFVVNPLNEIYNWNYQIFEGLEVINLLIENNSIWTKDSFDYNYTNILNSAFYIHFNKQTNYVLEYIAIDFKIYKDNVLFSQYTTALGHSNIIQIPLTTTTTDYTNGVYKMVVAPISNVSGVENFKGIELNEWTFTIADGEFDSTEFDNTEFLTN